MNFTERVGNVYVIDTKMFGFDRYNSAYIIEGKEIALIDTGTASSTEAVRAGIKAHGFSIEDISYIFITHAHDDHIGNAGILLKEMPRARVMIHPAGAEVIMNPSARIATDKPAIGEKLSAKFGEPMPVPPSRVETVDDGDVIDLGDGEKLRIIYAPGHQPEHIVILDEKNDGLFIGDATSYRTEADFLMVTSPPRSDIRQCMETIKMLMRIPVTRLFLGHYGICNKPKDVMRRALEAMQVRLDILSEASRKGTSEKELANRIIESMAPGLERLRIARGEGVYTYMTTVLVPAWTRAFKFYSHQESQRGNLNSAQSNKN